MAPTGSRTAAVPDFNQQRLVRYFFFAVFLFLLWQVLRILMLFYVAIMGSALLALLTYPLHERLLARLRGRPDLAACVSTAGAVLIVVLPVLLLAWLMIRETGKIYPVAQDWLRDTEFFRGGPVLERLPGRLGDLGRQASSLGRQWGIDPEAILLKNIDHLSNGMGRLAAGVITNALALLPELLTLAFTLFFFLRDGPYLIRSLVDLVPMAPRNKLAILSRIQTTLYAVLRGVFVVSLIQGVLAGIGFALFGVPFPVLLGALTAFLAPVPVLGSAIIWVPVAIGLFLSEAYFNACGVLSWGLIASAIEHVIRPLLISADAKVPLMLIFFGMFGGIKAYGFSGVLLGPVTIALLLAFVNIYRREYQWLLAPSVK